MAESTLAAGALQNLVDDTSNNVTNLMANLNLLRNALNASLETTSTGHTHDGTDSRKLAAGLAPTEVLRAQIMGVFT